jgi:hypothetical protein
MSSVLPERMDQYILSRKSRAFCWKVSTGTHCIAISRNLLGVLRRPVSIQMPIDANDALESSPAVWRIPI